MLSIKTFAVLTLLMLIFQPLAQPQIFQLIPDLNLEFNPVIQDLSSPIKGVSISKNLIGCWNLNEASGIFANDSTKTLDSGIITSASWVTGKFGSALNFDVGSDITIPSSDAFNIGEHLTLSAWIYARSSGQNGAGRIIAKNDPSDFGVAILNGRIYFVANGTLHGGTSPIRFNEWHFVTATFDVSLSSNQIKLYVDGNLQAQATLSSLKTSLGALYIGNRADKLVAFDGLIDAISIYNSTLSATEINTLFVMGEVPDSSIYADYYTYTDPFTENKLILNIENTQAFGTALLTCTNFFVNRELTFQTNNSVTINMWTTLGKPAYTTGIWNPENYTITLTATPSSIAQLTWNITNLISATNMTVSKTTANSSATFSTLWSGLTGLIGGGYIFSTNNTGRWVNSSWTVFTQNPEWGNSSLILTALSGIAVGFREYANNSLNIWGDSGVYTVVTTSESITPTPTALPTTTSQPSNITQPTPTHALITPKPTNLSTENPTSSQTAQPKSIMRLDVFIEYILIIAVVFVAGTCVLIVAIKKGVIKIEVINEKID